MANNSPTNLSKGGEKDEKPKSVEDMLKADNSREKAEQEDDVTKRELTAEDTEPVVEGGAAQAAADLALEQARGRVFGDITSSNGDSNTRGLHGRDGGIVPDGPSNPAPSDAAIAPEPVEESAVEKAPRQEENPKT